MKTKVSAFCFFGLLLAPGVSAQRGGGYFATARVTISGPSTWGAVQAGVTTQNLYTIASSPTTITAVGISGDPQFTVDSTGCVGTTSCTATVSFNSPVGGDYTAVLGASAAAGTRVHPGSGFRTLTAHVIGGNYTLTAAPVVVTKSNDTPPVITATFTLTSTGETDLHISGVTATDGYGNNAASISSNTCAGAIPSGSTCQIVVTYLPAAGADGTAAYSITVGVTADTRPRPPLTISGVVSFND